jgi:hypothetical protein
MECVTCKRSIIHTEDDNALMLGGVFCYSAKMGLQYMVAVEEGHFSVWFYPDLDCVSMNTDEKKSETL